MLESTKNIDTGALLKAHLKKYRIPMAELARGIGKSGSSVGQYQENKSIQTGSLIDICYALEHNFFQDIANRLPGNFTQTKSFKDRRIAELEEEVKMLKMQQELLLKVVG